MELVFLCSFRCPGTDLHDSLTGRGHAISGKASVLIERPPTWAYIIPAALSLIALLELPYGYYQFLRIVVTGICVWLATWHQGQGRIVMLILFATLAILFNPVFKIHMEREVHAIFNILVSTVLVGSLWIDRRRPD